MLICLSVIFIQLRRNRKHESHTTTKNTPPTPANTEGTSQHYEYIDTDNSYMNNEQTTEQYENLRSSDDYEEMSDYDIIIKQNTGCANTTNINLHQYEPLRGSKKRSHVYSDTRSDDEQIYLEVYG